MASTFDLHTVIVLYEGWQQLAKSEDSFVEMLPRLPEGLRRTWHRILTDDSTRTDKISIGTAFNLRRTPPPCWIVQLEDGTDEAQTLGHVNGELDEQGRAFKWMIEQQTVTITSIAGHKELLRAMHTTAKALMMIHSDWFIEAKYGGIMYAGGGDLSPEESLESELTGMFLRTQRWRTHAELEVLPVARIQRKPWLVVAADIVVDGVRGGAQPVEDTGGT